MYVLDRSVIQDSKHVFLWNVLILNPENVDMIYYKSGLDEWTTILLAVGGANFCLG